MGLRVPKSLANSIAINRQFFSSLSFLNVYLVGLDAKEYYMTIFIPIAQNISHCGDHFCLKITPKFFSDSLYLAFALCRPYVFTAIATPNVWPALQSSSQTGSELERQNSEPAYTTTLPTEPMV